MGLFVYLRRRFSSLETNEEDAALSVDRLHELWGGYTASLAEKRRLVVAKWLDLPRLRAALSEEIKDIGEEVKVEEGFISDLGRIRYAKELKRARQLHEALAGSAAEARALFSLLESLYEVVRSELHLVEHIAGGGEGGKHHLLEHVRSEEVLVARIGRMVESDRQENESRMFHALVRGARIVRKLDAKELTMRRALEAHYARNYSGGSPTLVALDPSETARWVDGVFARLKDAAYTAESRGDLVQGPYFFHQFVNDDHLVSALAMEVLGTIRDSMEGIDTHHPLVKAFVESFRETYNERYLFD